MHRPPPRTRAHLARSRGAQNGLRASMARACRRLLRCFPCPLALEEVAEAWSVPLDGFRKRPFFSVETTISTPRHSSLTADPTRVQSQWDGLGQWSLPCHNMSNRYARSNRLSGSRQEPCEFPGSRSRRGGELSMPHASCAMELGHNYTDPTPRAYLHAMPRCRRTNTAGGGAGLRRRGRQIHRFPLDRRPQPAPYSRAIRRGRKRIL